jgi:hypothetical protein
MNNEAVQLQEDPQIGMPLLSESEWSSSIGSPRYPTQDFLRSARQWQILTFDISRWEEGHRVKYNVKVPTSDEDATWKRDLAKRLAEFMTLPEDWDSHGAPQLSFEIFFAALKNLESMMTPETLLPDVVPTVRGGIQIEWHDRGIDVEVEVEPDKPVGVYIAEADAVSGQEGSFEEMGSVLRVALNRLRVVASDASPGPASS